MMEYERVTDKNWHKEKFYPTTNNERVIRKRLWDLENKIENGTLKEEKTCTNISEMHPTDGFTCSECGITVIDFREERVDKEDYTANWYEYEMKYCPNCGAKVVQNG